MNEQGLVAGDQGKADKTKSRFIIGLSLVLSAIGAVLWLCDLPSNDRHSDDLADSIVTVFSVATLLLSIWNVFKKAPFLQRVLPLILQVLILGAVLFPSLHGWPNELIIPMMFMLALSPFGFASAYSLDGSRFRAARTLGFTLFVEVAGVLLIMIVDYLRAYVRYGGYW